MMTPRQEGPSHASQELDATPRPQLQPHNPSPVKKVAATAAVAIGIATFLVFGSGGFDGKGAMPVTSNENEFDQDHALNSSYQMSVGSQDLDSAYTQKAMQALKQQAPQVAADFSNHGVKWYTLRVWDAASQDGDVVSVSVNGRLIAPSVPLTNSGTAVPIPLAPGTNHISIRGLQEGSLSTVTVGAVTETSAPVLAALPVGGTLNINMAR